MPELLVLVERVRNTICLGESHFREFKTAWEGRPGAKKQRNGTMICRDIGEALVAFANADGGDLLIGVEDNGDITGIPHGEEEIQKMLQAPTSHVHAGCALPMLIATSLQIDGKTVLLFSVAKGKTGIYQLPDGRCVKRRGTSSEPESVEQLLFAQGEARSRAYDSEFVDGDQATDLDVPLLQSLANNYLQGITPEKYLQQIGLADYSIGGLQLRRAALLPKQNSRRERQRSIVT